MSTSVPGIHLVEHLPLLAQCMEDMAIVRSMSTEINGHYDAKYFLHTGYKRTAGIDYPALGAIDPDRLRTRRTAAGPQFPVRPPGKRRRRFTRRLCPAA